MSTSSVIDYKKTYCLRDPLATRPLRLCVSGYSDWVTSDQSWAIFKAQLLLDHPLKLGTYRGGQATDFLWSGLIALKCISDKVKNLLQANAITGWTTYPVEVFGRKGEPISGYYGLAITGPECRRDRSFSRIITKPAPAPGGESYQVYKGLYFDETEWDGSDFFLIRNKIVITERVYNIFRKAKVTNVQFVPLDEVELDVYLDRFENNS